MKMWQLHKAIETLGLAEHGDKEVIVDVKDGRYPKVKLIEAINNDEVIVRLR